MTEDQERALFRHVFGSEEGQQVLERIALYGYRDQPLLDAQEIEMRNAPMLRDQRDGMRELVLIIERILNSDHPRDHHRSNTHNRDEPGGQPDPLAGPDHADAADPAEFG